MTTNPITDLVQKSPRALATRSLTAAAAPRPNLSTAAARSVRAVERIKDTNERREAFAQHMERFPPTIGRL